MTDIDTGRSMTSDDFWFPGRWVGGTSLVVAPLLLLAGVLLRVQFHFFFPQQLAAYQAHPTLIAASYGCFLAGNIALWPAIVTLTRRIGATKPTWALWGGSLVMFGLFARTFHAGVDHLAFQLVRTQDVSRAASSIAGSYGAFHVVSGLTGTILIGWIVLAIGAYVSGTLGLLRSIALGLMAALMIGVLKGTSPMSVVATAGLAVALIPVGISVLREAPTPSAGAFFRWYLAAGLFVATLFYLGQLG